MVGCGREKIKFKVAQQRSNLIFSMLVDIQVQVNSFGGRRYRGGIYRGASHLPEGGWG